MQLDVVLWLIVIGTLFFGAGMIVSAWKSLVLYGIGKFLKLMDRVKYYRELLETHDDGIR